MRLADCLHQTRFASSAHEAMLDVLVTASWLSGEISQSLSEHGLTMAQYNALRILRGSHPERLTCTAVGERLLDRTPDVTRLLDRLERAGLAERVRAEHDRRVVHVGITPQGLRLLGAAQPAMADLETRLAAIATPDEFATLSALLERLREAEATVSAGAAAAGAAPAGTAAR